MSIKHAILAIFLVTSFPAIASETPLTNPIPFVQNIGEKIRQEILPSSVEIHSSGKIGSGTVVFSQKDENNRYKTYVLTNSHVVTPEDYDWKSQPSIFAEISVPTFDAERGLMIGGNVTQGVVISNNPDLDLAVIVLLDTIHQYPVAKIGKTPLKTGDPLVIIGYPLGQLSISEGLVGNTSINDGKIVSLSSAFAFSGSSGGSAWTFDSTGNLVFSGIIYAIVQTENDVLIPNMSKIIYLDLIKQFLTQASIPNE